MSDINNQLARILQSTLSQQVTQSIHSNQVQIQNLQHMLLNKNQEVLILHSKLQEQLKFIHNTIKRNAQLEKQNKLLLKFVHDSRKQYQQLKLYCYDEVKTMFDQFMKLIEMRLIQIPMNMPIFIQNNNEVLKPYNYIEKLVKQTQTIKQTLQDISCQTKPIIGTINSTQTLSQLLTTLLTCQTQTQLTSSIAKQVQTEQQNNQKIVKIDKSIQNDLHKQEIKKLQSIVQMLIDQKQKIEQQMKDIQRTYEDKNSREESQLDSNQHMQRREFQKSVIQRQIETKFINLRELKYYGQLIQGIKTGEGACQYQNNFFYQGNFTKNKKQGLGKFSKSQELIYQGQWEDNYFHGRGILYYVSYPKAQVYYGNFHYGEINGYGTMVYSNGQVKIRGKWKNGKCWGRALLIDQQNKLKYLGEMISETRFVSKDGKVFDI